MITNIVNNYVGDSSVSRIYQGENLIYDSNHPDILLEWISNGNDASQPNVYFDLNFAPGLRTRVEVKYSMHTKMDSTALFGSINGTFSSQFFMWLSAGTTMDGVNYTTNKFWCKGQAVGYPGTPTVDTPHTIAVYSNATSVSSATKVGILYDGTGYSSPDISLTGIENPLSMYVFARNSQGTAQSFCPADTRIYYVKAYDFHKLFRFWIPVLHWDGSKYVPCFWDEYQRIYVYNLGTDNVSYKIKDDYVLSNIYRPSGQDKIYFNTNVGVVRGRGIDVGFKSGSSVSSGNINENIIVGVRDASGNKYGMYAPYSGIAGSTTASWYVGLRGLGYNLNQTTPGSFDTFYRVSSSPTIDYKNLYVNGTAYTTSTAESSSAGAIGSVIGMFGNVIGNSVQTSFPNTAIYYCNLTNSNLAPVRTYIPVLHGGVPCFYEFITNTYLYNSGEGTPGYELLK